MLSLPIETIIFDLDGTLRHSVPSADDTQFHLTNQLGAGLTPEHQNLGARWAHYYWAQSAELSEDLEKFGETNDAFWANYCFRYLLSLHLPEKRAADLAPRLAQLMETEYNPENWVAPEVPETLAALRKAGYTVGLVSNRSRSCQEECAELGLLPFFEFAYVAAEVDAWKPDPRIFDRALEISGTPRGRILYVGDNYYADIVGAENAGLQPVLLDRNGVFPEADCTVIRSIGELPGLLG